MAETSKKGTRRANGETAIYFGKDGRWHARVPMGYRDNGEPYRRHITRATEDLLKEEVKRLEKQRDQGTAQQPGKLWTVEKWLWHWVENIAKEVVSENTYDGYEVAVRVHLVPGIGKHRIDRLEPEHLESLYRRMKANGSKPATAHQAHRTARTALGEAVRRGHAAKNAAALAKPPRVEEAEDEIEPYSVEEIQSLLIEVNKRRNSARWMLALALGLRQGDAGAPVGRRGPGERVPEAAPEPAAAEVRARMQGIRSVRPEGRVLPPTQPGAARDEEHQVARWAAGSAPAGAPGPDAPGAQGGTGTRAEGGWRPVD